MEKLTYRQMLLKLQRMTDEELNSEVRIFDKANDCYIDELEFAEDMDEFQPLITTKFDLVIGD